ncbi:MAG TPA: NAD(+) diphosphatase [Xanthobacteraceae bacterium]|nr:NAD(+) diphosphatase [Xanthobacteraceae bacterium]
MPPRPDLGPKPRLGYAGGRINHAVERRADLAALAKLAEDPASRFYLVGGEVVVLKSGSHGHDPLFASAEIRKLGEPAEVAFLGLLDGAPRFAAALAPDAIAMLQKRGDIELIDLRSIAVRGLLDGDHLCALAEARALLNWHARHRFCANCGAATRVVEGGWRRDCPSCRALHFPRTDPVVIMLAVAGDRCVLGRSHRFASGMWSCLAGFVEPGETIEEAVRRETAEEAGIACGRVAYFASQPWPFPMSLMIGCHAEACSEEIVIDRTELDDARWFSREEVAAMLLGKHPEGLTAPLPVAIAHHILRAWVEQDIVFD